MRYGIFLLVTAACGSATSSELDTVVANAAETENLAENFSRENPPHDLQQSSPMAAPLGKPPIPALILPNNVCIINTDLSPDSTIEEHIRACVRAHRIRQSITK